MQLVYEEEIEQTELLNSNDLSSGASVTSLPNTLTEGTNDQRYTDHRRNQANKTCPLRAAEQKPTEELALAT